MSRMKKSDLLALWNGALPEGTAPIKGAFDGKQPVEYALRLSGDRSVGHGYVGGGGLIRVGYELLCRAFCTMEWEEEEACEGLYERISALFDCFPTEGEHPVFGGGLTVRPHRVKDYGNGRVEFSCGFTLDRPDFGTAVPEGAPYLDIDGRLLPIEGLLSFSRRDTEQETGVTYRDECAVRHTRVHGKDEIRFSFERCTAAEGQNALLTMSDRSRIGNGSVTKICEVTELNGEKAVLVCPVTVLIEEMDLSGSVPVFSGRMLGAGERYYARLTEGETGARIGERICDESN